MPSFDRLITPALSFNGGYVDTIGFLALQGLFTAHVTGNFVTLGVSIVDGTAGAISKLLALPLFVLVVGLAHRGSISLSRRGEVPLRWLLSIHTLLLALFTLFAICFGPFTDSDSPLALLTGMTAVSAMAIQNAISRTHLPGTPPTTLMTGNVTQIALDIVELITQSDSEKRALIKTRMQSVGVNLVGFALGCISAALLYLGVGFWSLVIAVFVATWVTAKMS